MVLISDTFCSQLACLVVSYVFLFLSSLLGFHCFGAVESHWFYLKGHQIVIAAFCFCLPLLAFKLIPLHTRSSDGVCLVYIEDFSYVGSLPECNWEKDSRHMVT